MTKFKTFLENKNEELINQIEKIGKEFQALSRTRKYNEEQYKYKFIFLLQQIEPLLQHLHKEQDILPFKNAVLTASSGIYLSGKRFVTHDPEIDENERKSRELIHLIDNKIKLQERPTHQHIVMQQPKAYGIASDYLQDNNGSDYLITLHKAVHEGKPENLFIVDGTNEYPNNHLFDDTKIKLFPIIIKSAYQKILGFRKHYEIYIKAIKNEEPKFTTQTKIKIFSRFMPDVKDPSNHTESLEAAKNLCTKLNKGEYDFFKKYVDQYMQKMIDSNKLIASRSRVREELDPEEIQFRKERIMSLTDYML